MSIETSELLRFYPLAFDLALTTLVVISRRTPLGDERTLFAHALEAANSDARTRVALALERRRDAERMAGTPLWIGVALCFAVGAASWMRVIDPPLAFALTTALYVLSIIAQMLTLKREGRGRRVASMTPRRVTDLVPLWLLATPVFSNAAGMAIALAYGIVVPIVVAVATSAVALLFIPYLARTPAVITGEDVVTDELVDEKIRSSRVRQMLLIGAYAPLLVVFTTRAGHVDALAFLRIAWTLSLAVMLMWSSRRLAFTQDDLGRMYGV